MQYDYGSYSKCTRAPDHYLLSVVGGLYAQSTTKHWARAKTLSS